MVPSVLYLKNTVVLNLLRWKVNTAKKLLMLLMMETYGRDTDSIYNEGDKLEFDNQRVHFVDRMSVWVGGGNTVSFYRRREAGMSLDPVVWISSQRRVRVNMDVTGTADCLTLFCKVTEVVLYSQPLLSSSRRMEHVISRSFLICANLKTVILRGFQCDHVPERCCHFRGLNRFSLVGSPICDSYPNGYIYRNILLIYLWFGALSWPTLMTKSYSGKTIRNGRDGLTKSNCEHRKTSLMLAMWNPITIGMRLMTYCSCARGNVLGEGHFATGFCRFQIFPSSSHTPGRRWLKCKFGKNMAGMSEIV